MIKNNLKKIIFASVVILLPIAAGLILWDKLPEKVPTHFNLYGEPDSWSSKAFAVFGLPLFILFVHLLCAVATSMDPKKKNIGAKQMSIVLWICPVCSLLVAFITYPSALGYDIKMGILTPIFMGLLFIIIGNYLPKCRQNYTVGIKIPWTLESEDNWNKTHRLAGRLWVACGIIILVTAFFNIPWVFFSLLPIAVFVPVIYSYSLYRKNKD